jgi:hypothetical protein
MELYHHSPNTPSWRGAQLKAQEQLYLYLTFTVLFPCSVLVLFQEISVYEVIEILRSSLNKFMYSKSKYRNRSSSVSIMIRQRSGRPGFSSRQGH